MILAEFEARLRARAAAAAVSVTGDEVAALHAYFRLLTHWNSTINLTALPLDAAPDRTIDRLLIEPLVAATFVENASLHWLDMGSGGGSPAIPIKIARPLLRLTMIEAKARKAAFLREVVRAVALSNTKVENVRFENISTAQPFDLITVRAVRPDEALFSAAERLLASTGRLLLFHASSSTFPDYGFKRTAATPTLSIFRINIVG